MLDVNEKEIFERRVLKLKTKIEVDNIPYGILGDPEVHIDIVKDGLLDLEDKVKNGKYKVNQIFTALRVIEDYYNFVYKSQLL